MCCCRRFCGEMAEAAAPKSGSSTPRKGSGSGRKEAPVYNLCNFVKKDGAFCNNRLVHSQDVVCFDHMIEATVAVPAYVSVMTASKKTFCVMTASGNMPFANGDVSAADSETNMVELSAAYKKAVADSYAKGEGFGCIGKGYTHMGINLFDTALGMGVKLDEATMEVYRGLVAHRRQHLDKMIAMLKEQLLGLVAERYKYMSFDEQNVLLQDAQGLSIRQQSDETMQDRADSD